MRRLAMLAAAVAVVTSCGAGLGPFARRVVASDGHATQAAFSSVAPRAGSSSQGPPLVAALGDSVTIDTESTVSDFLFPRAVAVYYAAGDYMIGQIGSYLGYALERHPYAVVVNLGTNDAIHDNPHALPQLVAIANDLAAARVPCVAFVTVTQKWHNTVAPALDAYVRSLPAHHAGWHVIDWWAWSSTHPQDLQADGIHPDTAGQVWLGLQYAGTVFSCMSR